MMGHEGLIIRDTESPYMLNNRSRGLLKYKHMETEEFTIIGAEEAEGRDKGTVIWVCETEKGDEFTVRPKGTQKIRKEWFNTQDQYIGKLLTVQFQGYTKLDRPRFPVGIEIRDYE